VTKLNEMKHLLTLAALLFGLYSGTIAQDSWPWNVDIDGDGLVGTTDLLGFLSVFGQGVVVETCSQGDLCRCDSYDYNVPGPVIYYPPSSCGVLYTKKTGSSSTYKQIRLSPDADSSDVVNIVQAGASANGNSYTGHISYQTLIDGSWVELFSMSHNESNDPRLLRYVFNGGYWQDAEATQQFISPE
jgi:hypothetical protein